ncbi:MAG: DUF4442 domain-containing protein [Myxococcales bacterium]|nr:DUF4442 domain-containing protein [Myxococcales bacterium]USN51294.1 MAG: DUF4442 domain-containing protein [Myxococcales bacterium]
MSMVKTLKQSWSLLSQRTLGKWLFSKAIGKMIPYSGSISPQVLEVAPGRATVRMRDKKLLRNHLSSFHALALSNLGELTTGLALHFALSDNSRAILVKLETDFLKKARGTITARSQTTLPKNFKKRRQTVEAQLFDEKEDLVAVVKALWLVEQK